MGKEQQCKMPDRQKLAGKRPNGENIGGEELSGEKSYEKRPTGKMAVTYGSV